MSKSQVQEILNDFDFYNDDPTNSFVSLSKLYDVSLRFDVAVEKWELVLTNETDLPTKFWHVNLAQVIQDTLEYLIEPVNLGGN